MEHSEAARELVNWQLQIILTLAEHITHLSDYNFITCVLYKHCC